MRKSVICLLAIPFLLACSKKPYNGPKIQVAYNETGNLLEASPMKMHSDATISKVDAVYYIGDDSCSACAKLKPQLEDWCTVYKGTIYYIPVSNITDANVNYLYEATEGYYQWTEKSTVPAVYFFMKGEVVFQADQTNAMEYLVERVEVAQPE